MSEPSVPLYISPSGGIGPLPPEDAANAQALGYVPASPEQVADFELQAKFSTVPQQAATFAEAAGRALTFGASTHIEKALGVPAEDIANRPRVNPGSEIAGTLTGIAGPLLAGGAGAFTAPGLIAKAGAGAAAKVAAALPKAVTLGERVGARALQSAAGAAVEGALYGAGQVVHEEALGDPNLTAQSAMAQIGGVGLLTGLLGGGVGAVGKLLGEGAKHLPGWLERVEAHANLQAAGGDKVLARKLRSRFGEQGSRKILLDMRDMGIIEGPLTTPATVMERAKEALGTNGKAIGDMITRADTAGADVGAATAARRVLDNGLTIAAELADDPLQGAAAARLQDVLGQYEQKWATLSPTLSDLHVVEQRFGQEVYGLGGSSEARLHKPLIEAYNSLRKELSAAVDKGVERGGVAAEEWAAANRGYMVAKRAEELAKNGLDRLAGNNPLSLTGTMGGIAGFGFAGPLAGVASAGATEVAKRYGSGATGYLARVLREGIASGTTDALVNKSAAALAAARTVEPGAVAGVAQPETVAMLSKLQAANDAIHDRIEAAVSTLARAGVKAQAVGRGEAAAGVAHVFGAAPDAKSSAFSSRTSAIERLTADPDAFAARLEEHTAGLGAHAPNTAQAMQITSARAAQFLASKIPHGPQTLGPLAPEWHPSQAQIDVYLRYHEAVANPLGILKQAAAGTITPEAVEAVRVVYPELFAQMQSAVMEKLASMRGRPPYQSILGMSAIMGYSLDGSTTPEAVMRNQIAFHRPQAQPRRATPARADKLNVANRTRTPSQSSAARSQ